MNRWRAFLAATGLAIVATSGYFLTLSNGQVVPDPIGRYRDGRGRFGRGGDTGGAPALAAFSFTKDYEFPSAAMSETFLNSEAGLVAACYIVTSGDANGCVLKCTDAAGSTSGFTITDPHTATCVDGPNGLKAYAISAASQAPDVVSTAINAIYGQVASTTLMLGFDRAAGPGGMNWWMDGYPGGAVGYMQIFNDPSNDQGLGAGFSCSTSGAVAALNPQLGWLPALCRYDGTNGGIDGTSNIDVALSTTDTHIGLRRDMQVGTHYIFGANNARDRHMNGTWGGAWFFNVKKTAAQARALQDRIWGVYNSSGAVTPFVSTSTQGEFVDRTSTVGNVHQLWTLAPVVDGVYGGLRTREHLTNQWAANALALATAVDVGTPVINSNVSSGPFAVQTGAAECDEEVEVNVAAFEGKRSLEAFENTDGGHDPSFYTASFFLKAGLTGVTTTKARISFTSDGTYLQQDAGTTGVCDVTGLTSTAVRYKCVTKITGATTVKANILVGNAASDVGSVQVCQGQLQEGPADEAPTTANLVRGDLGYTIDPSADSWPASSGNDDAFEVVFTPLWNIPSEWTYGFSGGTIYMVDAHIDTTDHTYGVVLGYTVANRILFIFRAGTAAGGTVWDLQYDGINLVAGHTYVTRERWIKHGSGCDLYGYLDDCGATAASVCHASTLLASDTTGTQGCPGSPNLVTIGDRMTGTVPSSVVIKAVRR